MRPVRVARDMVESQTRVELYGPLRRLETMRRNRELGERDATPSTPEDDAATILRRTVGPGLQDAEARLIAVQQFAVRESTTISSVFERNFLVFAQGREWWTYPSDVSVRRIYFTIP
jgi:hypothetical protein